MSTEQSQNSAVEIARFAAAFAIVLFHSGYFGGVAADFGVGYFAILMVFYLMLSASRRPRTLRQHIGGRARRLLAPWLVWSLIFAGLKLLQWSISGGALVDEFQGCLPHYGTQGHLWFLPWAFVVLMVALVHFGQSDSGWTLAGALALVMFPLILLGMPEFTGAFHNYLRYLPSVGIGLLAFQLRRGGWSLFVLGIGAVLLSLLGRSLELPGTSQLILAAPIALYTLFGIRFSNPLFDRLGALSFGIYSSIRSSSPCLRACS